MPDADLLERLTDKQIEALDLASRHFTSKEIAQRLGVSPSAVDQRIDGARAALGASNRLEAVRMFLCDRRPELACEQATGETTRVSHFANSYHQTADGAADPKFQFNDAMTYYAPAPWEALIERAVPEIDPRRMRTGARLAWIAWGAAGLAVTFAVIGGLVLVLNSLI